MGHIMLYVNRDLHRESKYTSYTCMCSYIVTNPHVNSDTQDCDHENHHSYQDTVGVLPLPQSCSSPAMPDKGQTNGQEQPQSKLQLCPHGKPEYNHQ